MKRSTRDEVMMGTARLMAGRGTCSRRQVGVVIERAGRILITGYNGAPAGMAHCNHSPIDQAKPCTKAIHAEVNAIAYAARWGTSIEGATMWSTCLPCPGCALLIAASGLSIIRYGENYWDTTGAETLVAAGLTLAHWDDRILA